MRKTDILDCILVADPENSFGGYRNTALIEASERGGGGGGGWQTFQMDTRSYLTMVNTKLCLKMFFIQNSAVDFASCN